MARNPFNVQDVDHHLDGFIFAVEDMLADYLCYEHDHVLASKNAPCLKCKEANCE